MNVYSDCTRKGNFAAKMRGVRGSIERRAAAGVMAAAEIAKKATLAKEAVPRDTEALALSCRITTFGSSVFTTGIGTQVGYGREGFMHTEYSRHDDAIVTKHPWTYAVIVHEGWGKYPSAQMDFLRGPFDASRPEMLAAIVGAFAR